MTILMIPTISAILLAAVQLMAKVVAGGGGRSATGYVCLVNY